MSTFSGDYSGLRATVMGLGRFGGGVGAVRFLAERGARVTVTDVADADGLHASLSQLDGIAIAAMRLGKHHDDDFRTADLVVVNPAVRPDNEFVEIARRNGAVITSEIRLFFRHCRGRIIGITGSNGKSTTTALIHHLLCHAGQDVRLGGNIGVSLLPNVDDIGQHEKVVLELSSFQLDGLNHDRVSPATAVVTGFAPNHLDWHGTLEHYRYAKQSLLRFQSARDAAVINDDDEDASAWSVRGRRFGFGLTDHGEDGVFQCDGHLLFRSGLHEDSVRLPAIPRLPGRHNLQNALAAAAAAMVEGVDADQIRSAMETFQPLPHRLQLVAEVAGRRFYNDSLATTPESTIAALHSFDRPVILLAGGYDKGIDLSLLAAEMVPRVRAVVLMGQTAARLDTLIRAAAADSTVHIDITTSFEQAFHSAVSLSEPGDVILLSPACASYDWFRNFAERGARFAELTANLEKQQRTAKW